MTYSTTLDLELLSFPISVSVSFYMTRAYPATRVDPAEPSYPEITNLEVDDRPCPGWLWDRLLPQISGDLLYEEAQGQSQYYAEQEADMRRDSRWEQD